MKELTLSQEIEILIAGTKDIKKHDFLTMTYLFTRNFSSKKCISCGSSRGNQ